MPSGYPGTQQLKDMTISQAERVLEKRLAHYRVRDWDLRSAREAASVAYELGGLPGLLTMCAVRILEGHWQTFEEALELREINDLAMRAGYFKLRDEEARNPTPSIEERAQASHERIVQRCLRERQEKQRHHLERCARRPSTHQVIKPKEVRVFRTDEPIGESVPIASLEVEDTQTERQVPGPGNATQTELQTSQPPTGGRVSSIQAELQASKPGVQGLEGNVTQAPWPTGVGHENSLQAELQPRSRGRHNGAQPLDGEMGARLRSDIDWALGMQNLNENEDTWPAMEVVPYEELDWLLEQIRSGSTFEQSGDPPIQVAPDAGPCCEEATAVVFEETGARPLSTAAEPSDLVVPAGADPVVPPQAAGSETRGRRASEIEDSNSVIAVDLTDHPERGTDSAPAEPEAAAVAELEDADAGEQPDPRGGIPSTDLLEDSAWDSLLAIDGVPSDVAELTASLESSPELRSAALLSALERSRQALVSTPSSAAIEQRVSVPVVDLIVMTRSLMSRLR